MPKTSSPMVLEDDQVQAKVHVCIVYTSTMCSHTTLRIYSPTEGAVFWDPAGGYGDSDYPVVARRVQDIIVEPVPTIPDYIHFRQYLPTSRMEIFEFEVDDRRAREWIHVLRNGLDASGRKFTTRTDAFYCSSRISEFLRIYCRDDIPVEKEFFPHNLARTLYAIPPDRVFIYDEAGVHQYWP